MKNIAENKKAKFEFFVEEQETAGIALFGSEVKSIRAGQVQLTDNNVGFMNGEMYVYGMNIPKYTQANILNHDPARPKKLLMTKKQLNEFYGRSLQKGLTIVVLKLVETDNGLFKVIVGLCKGKKLHDKREDLKRKDIERDMKRGLHDY